MKFLIDAAAALMLFERETKAKTCEKAKNTSPVVTSTLAINYA